jgi:DNA-binding NarL/FixJ family response regulator
VIEHAQAVAHAVTDRPLEVGRTGLAGGEIGVMVIDDEDLVRRGFALALSEAPGITVVAEARTGAAAIEAAAAHRPRVILADVGSARREDGIEFLRALAHLPAGPGTGPGTGTGTGTGTGIIVLTSLDLDDHLFHALRAGARGFLLKTVSQDELAYAVRSVAAGHAFICPAMTRRLIDRFEILPPPGERSYGVALSALSGREREVLTAIALGRSNHEIARELHLTPATVKSHVSRILSKLGLPNRVQAALLAYRVGLVRPPGTPSALRPPW